jgi:hypothetical protein
MNDITDPKFKCTWTSPDRPCFSQLPVAFQLPVTTQRTSLGVPNHHLASALGGNRSSLEPKMMGGERQLSITVEIIGTYVVGQQL